VVGAGLGLLLLSIGAGGQHRRPHADRVVLITVDALRADRLGCYGYRERPTSPDIDAWAREAVVFDRATVAAPWTIPSLSAPFTGRYPVEVGAYTNEMGISPDQPTLPELLRRKGFRTASFNTHILLLSDAGGFRRGFDDVFPSHPTPLVEGEHKVPFQRLEPDLYEWLELHAHEPFFVWIHDMGTHHPPTEGNPFLDDPAWDPYDAEVRWVDETVGRIVMKLQALDLWDQTLFILTADHGEALDDHGLVGHQNIMYDEVLRVPLIVQFPGLDQPLRVSGTVELLDLFRTIADFTGIEVPDGTRGESLVPLLVGRQRARKNPMAFHARYFFEDGHHELAVRDGRWKLLLRTTPLEDPAAAAEDPSPPTWSGDAQEATFELYQWALDPGETRNVVEAYPEVVERLSRALVMWEGEVANPPTRMAPKLDPATREVMRALGYE